MMDNRIWICVDTRIKNLDLTHEMQWFYNAMKPFAYYRPYNLQNNPIIRNSITVAEDWDVTELTNFALGILKRLNLKHVDNLSTNLKEVYDSIELGENVNVGLYNLMVATSKLLSSNLNDWVYNEDYAPMIMVYLFELFESIYQILWEPCYQVSKTGNTALFIVDRMKNKNIKMFTAITNNFVDLIWLWKSVSMCKDFDDTCLSEIVDLFTGECQTCSGWSDDAMNPPIEDED